MLLGRVNQDGQPLRLLLRTTQGRLWMAVRTYSTRAVKAMVVQMETKLTTENYSLFFVGMFACLISFASATQGIATFYTKYVSEYCFL
ncbi:hypothetical protein Goshw_014926 [Gossypium schwendimanii]|uniref:Uncharacterized protein n=1 Tax=Gossypium schwendimanii TaxID=34291 RepID=A0A7J9LWS9_GOSSC|nr:hypothetical protein [Gossypium schwendimanii]